MSYNFKNKVVIVTGASSGIGLSVAREFASAGSHVVMAARSAEKLEKYGNEIRESGGEVMVVPTDVSSEKECQFLIEKVVDHYGAVDILINNAGISMRANFIDVDINVLKRLMDVNFWGTVYCTRYALPYLLKNRGVVVGVSSIAGFHGLPGRTGYSASKFAMHGFLETVRIEHFKKGLHVMIIAPGFTSSNIRFHALKSDGSEQGDSPRNENKMMKPEYVARWVLKGIRKRKRTKILTWGGRFTAFFQRIIPRVVDLYFYKMMLKEEGSPLKST